MHVGWPVFCGFLVSSQPFCALCEGIVVFYVEKKKEKTTCCCSCCSAAVKKRTTKTAKKMSISIYINIYIDIEVKFRVGTLFRELQHCSNCST